MSAEQTQEMQPLRPMTRAEWIALVAELATPEFESTRRRNTRRYPVDGEITVKYEIDGKQIMRSMTVVNVSTDGLMLRHYPPSIPDDTMLRIIMPMETGPLEVIGRVMHCTHTLGGFKIGVNVYFHISPN